MLTAGKILVIAAHPDDEVLGCGGTLARYAANGAEVHVVFVADGVTSRSGDQNHLGEIDQRNAAARHACQRLGAREPLFLGFPDQRLDQQALLDITQAIERERDRILPDVVYTHHSGDLNSDHRVVCRAVLTAFRPVPGATARAIYGFEVASSTEWAFQSETTFVPQRFVDISSELSKKLAALADYGIEMREFPHPRSPEAIQAMARLRGATVGVRAAEAFTVYREIV